MRAALYVRLSEDSETTTSPARQEEICRRYAEARGWTVVGVYPDIDVSATHSGLDRPQLAKLRDHVQAKAIDVVIVWRLDRLGRSVLDLLTVMKEWTDAGVATASATENIDLTTPIGKAMVALIAIFAEMEAEAIKARVRDSIDKLRREGRFAGGTVPYGYVPVPHPSGPGRALAIDEAEAKVIREAIEMIRSGHSLGKAARTLNERGIIAPRSEARRLLRAGRDASDADRGVWRVSGLHRLLTSHHLAGRQTHRGELLRDPDTGMPVEVWPPIVDGAMVAHLRDLLENNDESHRKRVKQARVLSGLARCAVCRGKMYVSTSNGRKAYNCPNRRNGIPCVAPRIYAATIEPYVMAQAIEVLGQRPRTRLVPIANPAAAAKGISYAELDREIRETAMAMTADGADVVALNAQLAALKGKRAELRENDVPAVLYVLEETGETWAEAFSVADTDTQRLMLQEDIAAIWIGPAVVRGPKLDPDRVEIEYTVDNPEPIVVE